MAGIPQITFERTRNHIALMIRGSRMNMYSENRGIEE
jgi:hypothetical protein